MGGMRTRRLLASTGLTIALLLGAPALTACTSEGASTSCSTTQCTVTFDRSVEGKANILGVDVRLVGVEGQTVTLEVAGEQVDVQQGQPAMVGDFQVELTKITDTEVVVVVSRQGG